MFVRELYVFYASFFFFQFLGGILYLKRDVQRFPVVKVTLS